LRHLLFVTPLSQPAPGRLVGIHLLHCRGEPAAIPCSNQPAWPHKCQYAVLVTRCCSSGSAACWHTGWNDWTSAHHPHRRARCDVSRHMATTLTSAQGIEAYALIMWKGFAHLRCAKPFHMIK